MSRPLALRNLAVVRRDLGDLKGAITALTKAHEIEPADVPTLEELASFFYFNAEYRRAEYYAQKALRLSRKSVPARYVLGALWAETGKFESAQAALRKLAQEMPQYLPAYLSLARIHAVRGDWAGARRFYEKLLSLDRLYIEPRLDLARVLTTVSRRQEALAQYKEIAKVDPRHPEVVRNLDGIKKIADAEIFRRSEAFGRLGTKAFQAVAPAAAPPQVSFETGKTVLRRLRIGLGAGASGKPPETPAAVFMASGPLRIYLKKSKETIFRAKAFQNWSIKAEEGRPPALLVFGPGFERPFKYFEPIVLETDLATHTILLHDIPVGRGFAWAAAKDRQYRGRIELIPDKDAGIILVNDVPLSKYLYSVLPSEMPVSAPLEALKAQAIVARTFAMRLAKNERPHRRRGYDLCDSQHCQVYSGLAAERLKARLAVDETAGLFLVYKGRLINALYSANCGGLTQTAGEIKGWFASPYLQGVFDGEDGTVLKTVPAPPARPNRTLAQTKYAETGRPRSPWEIELWIKRSPAAYCSSSKYVPSLSYRWVWVAAKKDLEERANRIKPIGKLKSVTALKRSISGSMLAVKLIGTDAELTLVKEHDIRRILASGPIRSNMAVIDGKYDRKGELEEIYISGAGWGHNIGLCQGGTMNLAELKGWDFNQILRHYYRGTQIEPLPFYF
ncbi:MAG: SpoIID/LytB domain-containing protein [Elusimicrobia bacterium]|nr:SpoIID/LytB domain-containing protein [Elusimicrobiota bacterium]